MGSMYFYALMHRFTDSIIHNCQIVSFTINLEIMSKVGVQRSEILIEWHGIQRSDTTPVKTNGPAASSLAWESC